MYIHLNQVLRFLLKALGFKIWKIVIPLICIFTLDEKPCNATCSEKEFQCSDGTCIDRNQICDLHKDCLFGEDETQNCGKDLLYF